MTTAAPATRTWVAPFKRLVIYQLLAVILVNAAYFVTLAVTGNAEYAALAAALAAAAAVFAFALAAAVAAAAALAAAVLAAVLAAAAASDLSKGGCRGARPTSPSGSRRP